MELWTAYFIIFPGSVTNTKNIPKTGQAIPIAHNAMHFVFAMLVGHHSFVPISIHFPPHSSSEIKQQRVLHPISQQHKTFSPSKPSLHPDLLLSEVLWTCEGGTDSKLPRTPQNKFNCTRMQRRLAHSSLQLSWELGMAAVELLLLLLVLLVVLGAKHSYPL